MKVSKYTTEVVINKNLKMLYNTLSRQYYVFNNNDESKVKSFLENINKGEYLEEEITLFKNLLKKKIILQDKYNELEELEYLENSARYQENIYKIMIYATNACNFRCSYCMQPHESKRLDEKVAENIIKLVAKKVKQHKRIEIDWFGGEPMLEYDRLCHIMEQVQKICKQETSELIVSATTNGYLLDKTKIQNLKKLGLRWMQITLDGNKQTHDNRRTLSNGEGTFDVILSNIVDAVREGVFVTLRINVDEENATDVSEILDSIPYKYRHLIAISISNIFQNKQYISTYQLLKQVIEKGYLYTGRNNQYSGCHARLKNATIIDTDGSILLCSNTLSDEKRMGYLNDDGGINIERQVDYYRLQTLSARDNPWCSQCIELPFCISSCIYARQIDNSKCIGKNGDGLSLEERALLDYYYDLQKERKQTS